MRYLAIPLLSVTLLAGCSLFGDDIQTAKDVAPNVPEDIADTPVGTKKCQINSDCPADEWCYVTKEFGACTKKR